MSTSEDITSAIPYDAAQTLLHPWLSKCRCVELDEGGKKRKKRNLNVKSI